MEVKMEEGKSSDVRLRDVVPDDLPLFYQHQLDPEATRMAAFPSREHAAFMAHWQRNLANPVNITRTILLGDAVVGHIACFPIDGEHDIGYWIAREAWGKGVTTRALALFLPDIPIRPLYAHVVQHNIASRRVLEKCGF